MVAQNEFFLDKSEFCSAFINLQKSNLNQHTFLFLISQFLKMDFCINFFYHKYPSTWKSYY